MSDVCTNCGMRTFKTRAAEGLADAVEAMVRLRQIDSRSLAGDALLDYRNDGIGPTSMVTERGDVLARTAAALAASEAHCAEVHEVLRRHVEALEGVRYKVECGRPTCPTCPPLQAAIDAAAPARAMLERLKAAEGKLERVGLLVAAWEAGDEPEGAPSGRRTLLAINDVLRGAP